MSATAIGFVSSLGRGVAAMRAFVTVISNAATSVLSADASARFGLTRTNQKTSECVDEHAADHSDEKRAGESFRFTASLREP